MVHRIIIRAAVQAHGKREVGGGTSVYIDLPDGLSKEDTISLIAGRAAGEIARYLGSECWETLRWQTDEAHGQSVSEDGQ